MPKHHPAGRLRGTPPHPTFALADLDDEVLLTRTEMCAVTRCSVPTAELWAKEKRGPPVTRLANGQPRYRVGDVRKFIGLRQRGQGRDTGRGDSPAPID